MNNPQDSHQLTLADRKTREQPVPDEELSRLKKELLRAEVRLAKARATVVAAEVDVKVLGSRLKALAK